MKKIQLLFSKIRQNVFARVIINFIMFIIEILLFIYIAKFSVNLMNKPSDILLLLGVSLMIINIASLALYIRWLLTK